MRRPWPQEVNNWLTENVPGRTTKEVTELINQQGFDKRYGMIFTENMVKNAKNRLCIKSGTQKGAQRGKSSVYPDGMEEYIRSIASGKKTDEIARMVSEHFNIDFSMKQCQAYKKNHNIVSGVDCRFAKGQEPPNKGKPMTPEQYEKARLTMFKKGHIPANHRKIGDISKTTDGYLIKKVQEDGTQREQWSFLHRLVWEEQNGPVPEGKMISFLDGDKENCDIDNLILIDNNVNLEMNRSGLRSEFAEVTKTGAAIAALKVAIKEKKK